MDWKNIIIEITRYGVNLKEDKIKVKKSWNTKVYIYAKTI
jgi:hypothetical protein